MMPMRAPVRSEVGLRSGGAPPSFLRAASGEILASACHPPMARVSDSAARKSRVSAVAHRAQFDTDLVIGLIPSRDGVALQRVLLSQTPKCRPRCDALERSKMIKNGSRKFGRKRWVEKGTKEDALPCLVYGALAGAHHNTHRSNTRHRALVPSRCTASPVCGAHCLSRRPVARLRSFLHVAGHRLAPHHPHRYPGYTPP
ncbi:hypothetical protein L1887_59650 [Cichorium endivia]|nr:hypothetical protein L1887_59650 [Cichorium endivia]